MTDNEDHSRNQQHSQSLTLPISGQPASAILETSVKFGSRIDDILMKTGSDLKNGVSDRSSREADMLLSRYKKRRSLHAMSWHAISSLYYCPHCVQERLEPLPEIAWYEYLWMIVLLRPWHCPHCFTKYIRTII